jgi:hypothetical protein
MNTKHTLFYELPINHNTNSTHMSVLRLYGRCIHVYVHTIDTVQMKHQHIIGFHEPNSLTHSFTHRMKINHNAPSTLFTLAYTRMVLLSILAHLGE